MRFFTRAFYATICLGFLLAGSEVKAQYNIYFGNLHAHSSYSDGNSDDVSKIPADDYSFAKTSMCMDFLGISEHNHTGAGMSLASWAPGRAQAAAATSASFVALYGMEWGVISGGGHVVVYGIDSLLGWEPGQYQVYVPKSVYTGPGGLFDIINRHGHNAFGYMAHPNTTDYNDLLGSPYDVQADDAIIGSAVESGPAFSTNTTYTDPGSSMSYLSYYRSLLSHGYHVGPTIDHDNHNMTFGHTAKTRLAILSASLTENDLLGAMRQMRFYASEDCNARISFTVNAQPLGSIMTGVGAPNINISCTTTSPVSNIRIMYGLPSSGTNATQLTASASSSLSYTDYGLANLGQRYYYLDITETDGSRIITAPVWYTRNDATVLAQTSVTSFFAIPETDRVTLKWTTLDEAPNSSFDVERSIDAGRSYQVLGHLDGRGSSTQTQTYAVKDLQPFNGTAFYRLAERSGTGGLHYSDTRIVNRGAVPAPYVIAYPNPVMRQLNIKLYAAQPQSSSISIYDVSGRRVKSLPVSLSGGEQVIPLDLGQLSAGTYIIKLPMQDQLFTQLLNKL